MTKSSVLRSSTLAITGLAVVAAGTFAATSVSAHEGENEKDFKRIAHFQSEGKAWPSVLNPQHIERVAEKLDMSTEELEILLATDEGREGVHAQMKDIHDANKGEHMTTMAQELGMTVEEIEALMETEEGRESLHTSMKGIFDGKKGDRQVELAEKLGMTVEELEASKEDPALRESIREQMQELGLERPERMGHPHNFGKFRSHMAR